MPYDRIVVGLTTIPSRVKYLKTIVAALGDQSRVPDAICVSVPRISSKENAKYPLKEIAREIESVSPKPGVTKVVVVDQDYGPLTKLAGMILSEENRPGTLLITADDDQLYGPTFVETMVSGAEKYQGCAVCLCGHVLGKPPFLWGFRCSRSDANPVSKAMFLNAGTRVTVVSGWCGCAYPRWVFPGKGMDPSMEDLRLSGTMPLLHRHDDLYISVWLYLLGVPKVVIKYDGPHHDEELSHAREGALSSGDGSRSTSTMVKHLFEWWHLAKDLQGMGLLERDRVPWNKSTVFAAGSGAAIVTIGAIGVLVYALYRATSSRRGGSSSR